MGRMESGLDKMGDLVKVHLSQQKRLEKRVQRIE